MTKTHDDSRVDDLRQRLRSLGYLDAGVDRFVLGAASGTRRPAALAFLSSLRVGVLAALLLGPSAAIGLAARMPSLVTGPRDALVIAVYLGLFFGVAVAAAALAAGLIVARASGPRTLPRTRTIPRAAGIAIGLACLGYLTLWWRTVIADVGWSAPAWTVSALAIAVAISLVLGHAVMTMSSAVVVAQSGSDVAAHRSSWRAALAAAAVAFGGALLLLTWSPRTGDAALPSSPLTVVPSGVRVRVIAIDGFDARVFEELSRAGVVPALTAALQGSSAQLGTRDGSDGPDPARMWTTVATGQPPARHGVQGLETRRVAGMLGSLPAREPSTVGRAIRGATDLVRLTQPAIASGTERNAKTFWEVAAEAGLRTAVVNWWATWPARAEAGTVLTDRAVLRLEHGGSLDAEISPPDLYETLLKRWSELKGRARSRAAAALTAPADMTLLTADADTRSVLQRSTELDAMQLVLLESITTTLTDLAVVYLPGLDIAQHALLSERADREGPRPSTLAARLEGLRQYYIALDRLLADTLAPRSGELVLVITEPGRVRAETGGRVSVRGAEVPAVSSHRHATDVAPTILHVLGVPVARDLGGSPMLELFGADFVRRYPVRFVETYGKPAPKAPIRGAQPLDQEMIERLRSLGYVR